jgi:hypothetical protein
MKHRVIEHYELQRRLGAGGSGIVHLANDTELMRPVVLKILKRGSLTSEQMRTTVLREARLASAIEHPNVCAIYEVGEEGEEAFIVMQYVPGQPLDKLIARGPASLRSPTACMPRTPSASSIETSSRRTSSSPMAAWSRFSTSVSLAGSALKTQSSIPRRPAIARAALCQRPTQRVAAPSPTWRRSSL